MTGFRIYAWRGDKFGAINSREDSLTAADADDLRALVGDTPTHYRVGRWVGNRVVDISEAREVAA